MTTNNQPNLSKNQLAKSLLIALLIGGFVLLAAVLPAEYGKDPLGTGKLFGFSKLHQAAAALTVEEPSSTLNFKKIKMEKIGSPASVVKPSEADAPAPKKQYIQRRDTIAITVPAGKGIEYKVKSLKYGSTKYEWATDNGIVYIDFHGEVKQANPPKNVFYESYTLAYSNNMAGTLTAPFEGKHGWYFRNDGKEGIVVTLVLDGEYALLD